MNWDAIGAVGELVGALAVVLTLGYLAVQVRQSTTAMRVAAKQEMTRQFSDYTDLLLKNPTLLSVNNKGLRGAVLDDLESRQFNLMMQKATWYFASMHFQFSLHSLSEEEWHQSRRLIADYSRFPGYRAWWEARNQSYPAGFREFIQADIDSQDAF